MSASVGPGAARLWRAAGAALPTLLGAVAAAGAIALLLKADAWTALVLPAGLAVAVAAWTRPVVAVALLLALAPICGHRPTTGPFLAFVTLTACAVPGWLGRLATRDRALALDVLGTPVGLALAGYAGASLLSLSSLPIYAPEDIVGAASIGEALRLLPDALAGADVADVIYPALTVVLTLHALVAALTVAVALRRDEASGTSLSATGASVSGAGASGAGAMVPGGIDAARLVTGAILVGLVVTTAAGALDRLGYLDLRVLRATDPFTNASGAERLQSTFGHAGWFAEYVCFATPAILALWLWPASSSLPEPRGRRHVRLAAASALLGVSLVAIILSYQRGGWITWAIVGAGVVAAISGLASIGRAAAAAPSLRRLVATGMAAMIVAATAGFVVVRIAGGPGATDRFAARLRTITQVSDRQAHVTAGLRLGWLLPILGGGSESFAMRYQQEYLRAGGAFYARGRSPLLGMYGSAHNVFAQTFAGKGAVGLIALVLLVAASAVAVIRHLRGPEGAARSARSRVVALVALGTIAAFTIYGQVQEVFYIPPLQLTVFAAFGLAAGLEPALGSPQRGRWRLGVVTALLVFGLAAHLVHGYGVSGRLADAYRDREISRAGERLSPPVLGDDGEYFQWTGARAVVSVPRQATELSFDLRRSGLAARDVEVRFDGRPIDRIRLDDERWRRLAYPLSRVRALPRRLEIVVLPGPADAGAEADRGAAVRRIQWGLP
jgi:multisubunit Na+/H+ antiporter MnhF subunit